MSSTLIIAKLRPAFNHKANTVTQCGGKNLGPVIRIPNPPIQLEDSIDVLPVITSIASAGDEFRRGEFLTIFYDTWMALIVYPCPFGFLVQLLDSVPGTFKFRS